jgi:hypothetical protein
LCHTGKCGISREVRGIALRPSAPASGLRAAFFANPPSCSAASLARPPWVGGKAGFVPHWEVRHFPGGEGNCPSAFSFLLQASGPPFLLTRLPALLLRLPGFLGFGGKSGLCRFLTPAAVWKWPLCGFLFRRGGFLPLRHTGECGIFREVRGIALRPSASCFRPPGRLFC